MKFDVIIGNPPYQISDGGQGASAKPIYHKFIENAIDMSPRYISFIVPSRWFVGGKGLDKFRKQMLNDKRICKIVDFPHSKDCFPSVDIKGGVNYFLWSRNYKNNCEIITSKNGSKNNSKKRFLNEFGEIFIRDNNSISILNKVKIKNEKTMEEIVSSRKPFGFPTNFINFTETKSENSIKIFANKKIGFIDKNLIEVGSEFLSKYLVLITEASGSGEDKTVLSKPIITEKNSCCTETYIIIDSFETKEKAINLSYYIKTKFFRFLVSLIKNTQHGTKKVYRFVPYLPMDKEWTDEKLYKRYNLTQEEINYIEEKISPME